MQKQMLKEFHLQMGPQSIFLRESLSLALKIKHLGVLICFRSFWKKLKTVSAGKLSPCLKTPQNR